MKITFKFHFLFFVTAFICILTGLFKDFIIITSLITIHELGHILSGIYFKWKIEKVIFYPFGGLTVFNQKINASLLEEFVIAIMGPIFQIIFFYLIKTNNSLFYHYHYALLFFNLIPIYPLDGSKITNIFFNKLFSFHCSFLITIILSIISIVVMILVTLKYQLNLILFLVLLLLFVKVIKEYHNLKFIFNKFLFERYFYGLKYNKIKKIKGLYLKHMSKGKSHYFINQNCLIKEDEILAKMFDTKGHL